MLNLGNNFHKTYTLQVDLARAATFVAYANGLFQIAPSDEPINLGNFKITIRVSDQKDV